MEPSGTYRRSPESTRIPARAWASRLADFDGDGLMDFFVPNDKMNNSLFHNKGDGRFEEIAFHAGVALGEDGKFISGMGVDARDLDNDGLPDILFVALDNETFPFFRNTGKGEFADATRPAGWRGSRFRWPATHRISRTSTTTDGRTFS